MKIAEINSTHYNQQRLNKNESSKTNFKGGMFALNIADGLMSFIDKQGYLVSFLIQDGLGMTAPRIGTGLFRDREETGKLNFKEATEVMLREVLSGPYMMAVAPAMVLITGLFCKSMRTNTKLIKIVGDNFKNMIKEPSFDKSIQKDAAKFKDKFYRYNVEKFYRDTVPSDKDYAKAVDSILAEFKGVTASSMKERGEAVEKITGIINERILQTSSNLDSLSGLQINVNGKMKSFKVKDAIYAIRDFGIDAIERNKESESINENIIENIVNNFAARRLMFNIAGIVATLGGLAIIPKIYARGKVAPGAERLLKSKDNDKAQNSNNNQTSFRGRGINSDGLMAKIGKFLVKTVPDWIKQEFEYDGINFTKSLMASLALFGLLLPRGKKAYDRALVDENGKKDLSELNEILLRDTISSLGVVYTVPILTKCFVKGCESNTGFVLTNRASKDKSWYKQFIDVINPYSDLRVYSSAELQALYNNINNKTKMVNLCEYITAKEGDLSKILSKSPNANLLFNEKTFTLDSLKQLSLKEKNEKITNFIKSLDEGKANELISKVMQDSGKGAKSTITRLARGLYSVPGAITTVIISPVILGCLVPLLTYSNTRKAHAKMAGQVKLQDTNAV